MALVKVSKKEIEKHLKLTRELIERINMLGIPVENETEEEIEIEVMPNRPDALSQQGFIRILLAYTGKEQGLKKYKVNSPEKNYTVKVSSSVKSIRPYTACAIVKNLNFDDQKIREIVDIQEKLHSTLGRNRKKFAIGIYPLEKITLPIRFEARKPEEIKFVPLDMDEELNGLQILQKHPTGREYAHLLESCDKFPVFVDAKGKILSMPPIINSNETGKVGQETRDIFIECSGFDLNVLKKTINIITSSLADMGGKIYAMNVEYDKKIQTPDFTPDKLKISLENVNKLLGLNLKERDLEKLLSKMGYAYKNKFVYVPSWRIDVIHEVDVIEDVAIAYGYDNIKPIIPKVATIGEETFESRTERKIAEILVGLGLIEVSSYHLLKQNEADLAKLKKRIELENSKTEYKFLRSNLTIPALRIFSENKDNEYPQRIFEIGTVFNLDERGNSETGVIENENLVIACSPSNFTELKQILNYLTSMLKLKYELREENHEYLINGRAGSIFINGKKVGFIGEVHPETLRNWNLRMSVAILEISLEEIFKALNN